MRSDWWYSQIQKAVQRCPLARLCWGCKMRFTVNNGMRCVKCLDRADHEQARAMELRRRLEGVA